MRHGSIVNCLDVFNNNSVSGHVDGGVRFWDLASGERTAEMNNLHDGQITSVQFNPANSYQVLTNSRDNKIQISDMRMNEVVSTLTNGSYKTAFNWSRACFSPDGQYVASWEYENEERTTEERSEAKRRVLLRSIAERPFSSTPR